VTRETHLKIASSCSLPAANVFTAFGVYNESTAFSLYGGMGRYGKRIQLKLHFITEL
jgi:hypothetical protein